MDRQAQITLVQKIDGVTVRGTAYDTGQGDNNNRPYSMMIEPPKGKGGNGLLQWRERNANNVMFFKRNLRILSLYLSSNGQNGVYMRATNAVNGKSVEPYSMANLDKDRTLPDVYLSPLLTVINGEMYSVSWDVRNEAYCRITPVTGINTFNYDKVENGVIYLYPIHNN